MGTLFGGGASGPHLTQSRMGLSPCDFVLDWDPTPLPKRGGAPSPIFGKFLLCPNGWMHHDATWYGGEPQPRGLCVRWEPSPLPQKGGGALSRPQFSAHFYCGQTAGCIKMPLGMEVGLSPRDVVLDGDPAPPQQGGGAPRFSVHVYYRYCDFVKTLHSRYWFVQVQVQVLVLYALYF